MKITKTSFIAFFRKMFEKKLAVLPVADERGSVEIRRLNDNTDYIHEALGINEARVDEIGKMCRKAIIDHKDTVSCMLEISKNLTHPNELFFATWVLRNVIQEQGQDHIGAIIHKIFRSKGE
jgi:ferric iron reductase protein FhuF